ncbi:MAG: hypothetical protein LBR36_01050 [Bacteroidales bacterium]|nr:hypothetical protein [Bacteroidales bacterium]
MRKTIHTFVNVNTCKRALETLPNSTSFGETLGATCKFFVACTQMPDYQAVANYTQHVDNQAVTKPQPTSHQRKSYGAKNYQLKIKSNIVLCLCIREEIMRNMFIVKKINNIINKN